MMSRDKVPRRGEVWLAQTPGQPDDPHQPRPVLIISVDARNRSTDDVIVVPIFSNGRLGPTRVLLPAGHGGVHHDSVLFCDEITTIDHDFLISGPLGPSVPSTIIDAVVRAILHAVAP
jgi:mRNA-degrading endonuclease toxin of MazEF toxin-antitoxin module